MKRRFSISDISLIAVLWDLVVAYIAYTLCRGVFLILNWSLYAGTLTWGHGMKLFGAGLLFDTPAILYTNAIIMVMFWVLPCGTLDLYHRKQHCRVYEPDGLCLFSVHRQAHYDIGVCRVQQREHRRNAENLRRAVLEPLVPGAAGGFGHLGILEVVPTYS